MLLEISLFEYDINGLAGQTKMTSSANKPPVFMASTNVRMLSPCKSAVISRQFLHGYHKNSIVPGGLEVLS